jgi:O-antigen ligase
MAMLYLDAAGPRFWWKALLSVAFAIAVFGAISFLVPSFHESSFGGGEAVHIGELAINTKGRLFWWAVLWDSFIQSPYFGQGPGSFADVFHLNVQPHNDHLRLLHDFGVVGYSLWSLAIGGALAIIAKGWRRALLVSRPDVPVLMGAFLYCGAFVLTMITDNVLIYSPNAFPFAVLLGGALGIAGRLLAASRTEPSRPTLDVPLGRFPRRPHRSGVPL